MPSFFCYFIMADLRKTIEKIDALKKQRKFAEALEMNRQAQKTFKNARPVIIQFAQLQEIYKQYGPALDIYRNLAEEAKAAGKATDLPISLGIARCLLADSQYKQAAELLSQLRQGHPNNPDVLAGLAACARHGGQTEIAEKFAAAALSNDSRHNMALYEMAQIKLAKNEQEQALEHLERNFRRTDLHGDSIDLWITTLTKMNRSRYAQDTLEELAKKYPNVLEFVYGFAMLANRAGETSLARPAFVRASKLSPNNARIYYEIGVMERVAGDLDKSQEMIGKALALNPDNPAAIRTYGSDLKYAYGDENYKRLNYVAAKFSEFNPIEQLHLHYALAKAQEDVGELDAAFRHYEVAGAKKRKQEPFNERDAIKMIQLIPKVVTSARLGETNLVGSQSDVPVFILGMPRSGTSLMEQILSAHPDIFGAGELKILPSVLENIPVAQNRLRLGDREPVFPYEQNAGWQERVQAYVDSLNKLADKPGYKRIIDKMPGNFNFVGLIHAILPNAKIIHSRRHPVETCLSCYRIHFAEGHQWTYNLRELGRYYRRYWELMQYWREEFPGVMYEAVYEDNVADVEASARRLIDYLGLEWNDRCLEFYNVDRPVKTASVTQVRKPIYKTSTNRWRKYEKYLGPLLEELGDIVPKYEAEIAHLNDK